MTLYLVQHGKPLPKEVAPERPLSREGEAEVERVAAALKRAGISVSEVLHSGKARAEQTAEILCRSLGPEEGPRERPGLAPLDDPGPLAKELAEGDRDIMIVGHLPHLEGLSAHLLGSASSPVRFIQGGVLALEREGAQEPWRVAWFMVPALCPP